MSATKLLLSTRTLSSMSRNIIVVNN
nr:unnamed protein product [Callosobruchus analis]